MISLFWLVILFIIIFVLVIAERNLNKTYFSPFTLFAVPYSVIILYQIIITNVYNWKRVSPLFLICIILFLVGFFLTGNLFMCLMKALQNSCWSSGKSLIIREKCNITSDLNHRVRLKKVEAISIASAVYLIVFFILKAKNLPDIGMIVQSKFQNEYSSGLNFYLRLITMIGTAYFWGLANRNNKRFFLLGALCFIPNFLTFVKGTAFIMILGGLLTNLYINKKRRLKLKTLLKVVLSGVIIFFSVYMIEIGIWNFDRLLQKETYEFIFGKFNYYLVSGVQSFNINVNENMGVFKNIPNPVYAPIVNFISKFGFGQRIETINNIWVTLGNIPSYGVVRVNTNTYIGTLVLYCGLIRGMLVNIIISLLSYYFFWRTNQRNNVLNIVRYSLFVSGLILSWFEYYYMHTFWIYLIALVFLMGFVGKLNLTLKKDKGRYYKESIGQ